MQLDLKLCTDESLIDLAKKDLQAFQGLYDRYYKVIYNFILKRVNDREMTADITQQVFFNALTSIKKYRHQGHPFSAFLFRIAINECNQYFRDHRKVRFVSLVPEYTEFLRDDLTWDEAGHSNLLEKLKQVTRQLSHEHLLLLELRFFERKAFREIAYLLNITESLAKVKTYRLLSKLKTMMENEK